MAEQLFIRGDNYAKNFDGNIGGEFDHDHFLWRREGCRPAKAATGRIRAGIRKKALRKTEIGIRHKWSCGLLGDCTARRRASWC